MVVCTTNPKNERLLTEVVQMRSIFHGSGSRGYDQVRKNFQTKKLVRQGDPLLTILFNIVVDMLVILINRAKEEGQISGVIPNLVDEGLYHWAGKEYEATLKCFRTIVRLKD
jgi:hypothetical protein